MVVNGFNITKKGILTAYKGKSKDLEIPTEVVEIERRAFSGLELSSVAIPSSVQKIPAELFYNQKELTSVRIESAIEEIPELCFYSCEKLEQLVIPEGVTKIGKKAFSGCSSLKSVIFPSTLRVIENEAFWFCKSLKEAVLPDGLESVGKYAFYECNELFLVVVPDSVKLEMAESPFGFVSNKSHRRYVVSEHSKLPKSLLKDKKELEAEAKKYGFDEIVDVECVEYKPGELDSVLSSLRGENAEVKTQKPAAKLQI